MKKEYLIKTLIILATVPLLVIACQLMFNFDHMQSKLGLKAINLVGVNAIQGAIGGLLLSSALMNILGLIDNDSSWYRSTALVMFVVVIARIVGAIIVGFSVDIIPPIALEITIGTICIQGRRILKTSDKNINL